MSAAAAPVVGRRSRRGAVGPSATVEEVRENQRRAAPWPYVELDVDELRSQGWRPSCRCVSSCSRCTSGATWPATTAMSTRTRTRLARPARRHAGRRVAGGGGEPRPARRQARAPPASGSSCTAASRCCWVRPGWAGSPPTCGPRCRRMPARHRPADQRRAARPAMATVLCDARDHGRRQRGRDEAGHDRHRRSCRRSRAASPAYGPPWTAAATRVPVHATPACSARSPRHDRPLATYEELMEFEPPVIDFLLPHANWDGRPGAGASPATPYADWLIAVFDRWYGARSRDPGPAVRGDHRVAARRSWPVPSRSGSAPAACSSSRPTGASSRSTHSSRPTRAPCATGLDVRRDEFDDAFADPGIVARQIGRAALSDRLDGARSCRSAAAATTRTGIQEGTGSAPRP